MKVKFQTISELPKADKFSREFANHKKVVIPSQGDGVVFEELSYLVVQIVYNYAMNTIIIWLDSGKRSYALKIKS